MMPEIDDTQLARDIEAAVATFNRLAELASSRGIQVQASLVDTHAVQHRYPCPILTVDVTKPL